MNLLFVLTLLVITAAIALHLRWWRSRLHSTTRLPADLSVTEHRDWPLEDDGFSVEAADFLATADRVRAALRLRIDDTDVTRRRKAMRMVAHHLYRQLEVQAIFVEAVNTTESVDLYLFAADGRGWGGDTFISTAFHTVSEP